MNLKTLGLIVPLVSTGWLGFYEAANAAPKFANDDVLQITLPFFQVNAAGLPAIPPSPPTFPGFPGFPSLSTGEINGGADGLADALFGTYGVEDITPDNRVMDLEGTNTDYEPGDLGEFTVEPSSMGGFNAYEGQIGNIRSFDGAIFADLGEVNGSFEPPIIIDHDNDELPDGFFADNFLISLGAGNAELRFYLTNLDEFDLISSLQNGFGNLTASGFLVAKTDAPEVDFYRVTYELSAQALQDDGSSPDQEPGDGVTGAVTASGTLTVTIDLQPTGEPIPEPSTLLGLSAVAGVGALMKRNKLKKDK